MMRLQFPTDLTAILERLHSIDPLAYGSTRNFTDGNVTYLSPYISRGIISGRNVLNAVLAKGYHWKEIETFIRELAWREYFQRTWQSLEDDLFQDIRRRNTGTRHRKIPYALMHAATGIDSIDNAINLLYTTGYMHNHLRMYIASIACNTGKSYWQMPSQWMYYHLLDGDIASNTCSWQWVAGSFSSKQYYCNQDNINKYTRSSQRDTFLDHPYEELPGMAIPEVLTTLDIFTGKTQLPERKPIVIDPALPLLLYNSYNLDPGWHKAGKFNRILLLEPSHFQQFPVSSKVMQFILDLATNIEAVQIFVGELNEIPGLNKLPAIFSRKHPAFQHYPGHKEQPDWLFPEVEGHFSSFFSYWKKCIPYLGSYHTSPRVLIPA